MRFKTGAGEEGRIEHPPSTPGISGVDGWNLGYATCSIFYCIYNLIMGKLFLFVVFHNPNLGLKKILNTPPQRSEQQVVSRSSLRG